MLTFDVRYTGEGVGQSGPIFFTICVSCGIFITTNLSDIIL